MASKTHFIAAPTLAQGWVVLALVTAVWLDTGASRLHAEAVGSNGLRTVTTAEVYAQYGGSASCRECHEEAYAAWKKSNHGLAERLPLPDFENAAFMPPQTFHHASQQTSLRVTNGIYQLITAGLHGSNETFKAERVIGNFPLRQMLVPVPGGRWQVSEAAWDPRTNEWFNVYGTEDRMPGEWGHWLGRGMNWNSMCAVCHNTRLRKSFNPATDTYHTTMVEMGVGCESCHGPMKAHNDWQHAHKDQDLVDPTIRKITREQMFETCAGCHSRRAEITGDAAPGDSYWDHHLLTIVDDSDIFYPDGQIWNEDYEFTAFLGSRMHDHGVRCMDCHNIHTLKTKLPGNMLCLSCHAPGMTNAPTINPVTHSHHQVYGYNTNGIFTGVNLENYRSAPVKESGGECVNCHMPQTVYMQRHWRHDHGFTIPDPLLTKQFGIPNACERCHADKGTDWNLSYVDKWYGTNMNRLYRQRAQTVARAKQGDAKILTPLTEMLTTESSPYWQSVAARMLARWANEPVATAALLNQLSNTNPLVREMTVFSLGPLAEGGRPDIVAALQPRLQDGSRNVRIETARHLAAMLDTNSLAGREYLAFLDFTADQPAGQLQMGAFEARRGDLTNAVLHYQKAVQQDPYSPPIRHDMAILLSQLGRMNEAVEQLEAAIKLAPKEAEYHYKLALALNEAGDTARVISELEQAVLCDPHHPRAWYNLGLARNGRGDVSGALDALIRAESSDPNDPQIPFARATVLLHLGKLEEAKAAAQRALAIDPHFNSAGLLLQQLENH